MPEIDAESAYFFKHAITQQAAYQMQIPSERLAIHSAAVETLENLIGGRQTSSYKLGTFSLESVPTHTWGSVASSLTIHLSALAAAEETGNWLRTLQQYLQIAAEHESAAYHRKQAAEIWQVLSGLLSGPAKAEALLKSASLFHLVGKQDLSDKLYDKALEIAEESGDKRARYVLLASVARTRVAYGSVDTGKEYLEQSLSLMDADTERQHRDFAMLGLADLHRHTGEIETSERIIRELLGMENSDDIGDSTKDVTLLRYLATILNMTGRNDEAETILMRNLSICRSSGNSSGVGDALNELAMVYLQTGRDKLAEQTNLDAIKAHEETGHRINQAAAMGNLGTVYSARGETERALEMFIDVLNISLEIGDRIFQGIALSNIGSVYVKMNNLTSAKPAFEEAYEIHLATKNVHSQGVVLGSLGDMYSLLGEYDKATDYFTKSMQITEKTKRVYYHNTSLLLFGLHLMRRGEYEHGKTSWCKGIDALKEMGNHTEVDMRIIQMKDACKKAGTQSFI